MAPLWCVPVHGRFSDEAAEAVAVARIDVWRTSTGTFGIESTSLVVGAPRRQDALRIVQGALTGHALCIDSKSVSLLTLADASTFREQVVTP